MRPLVGENEYKDNLIKELLSAEELLACMMMTHTLHSALAELNLDVPCRLISILTLRSRNPPGITDMRSSETEQSLYNAVNVDLSTAADA